MSSELGKVTKLILEMVALNDMSHSFVTGIGFSDYFIHGVTVSNAWQEVPQCLQFSYKHKLLTPRWPS